MLDLRNGTNQDKGVKELHTGCFKLKDDEAQQLLLAIAEAKRAGFEGTCEALLECLSMVIEQ